MSLGAAKYYAKIGDGTSKQQGRVGSTPTAVNGFAARHEQLLEDSELLGTAAVAFVCALDFSAVLDCYIVESMLFGRY